MSTKMLTPITLWNDFDDSLPLNTEIVKETERGNAKLTYIKFSGRAYGSSRVRIFGLFAKPLTGSSFPALLILPDVEHTCDEDLALHFVEKGYAVLMVDYGGVRENGDYTIYPEELSYANFRDDNCARRTQFVDDTAKETSWYEWVGVARYSLKWMRGCNEIGLVGVLGLKRGGDVAWQLAATADVNCVITVCAGGWNAYRGICKFGDNTELKMNDERYRFLAAVDAQAYAQYVRCPVLMLCATNDSGFDADRAFDTFARINSEQEKTFYFSARYDGHIGNSALNDLHLFTDKYLKGREVFMPEPVEISIEEDEGDLVAKIRFDRNGEAKYCEVYMAEDNLDSATRDWTRCSLKRDEGDGVAYFYLNAYEGSKMVFAFAKAKYSCGFAVSSKIAVKRLEKRYLNSSSVSRILYSSKEGTGSFTLNCYNKNVVADCFLDNTQKPVYLKEGPCGIKGVSSSYGLRLYRLSDSRYRPSGNALLKLDVYSDKEQELNVGVVIAGKEKREEFICKLRLPGGEKWFNYILSAKDFKNEVNKPLSAFSDGTYVTFSAADEFCLNNFLWL